jgi:hypothetical protein
VQRSLLVSIVVGNYNYAQYVGRAIQSALDQTYGNIEVIVVDDGSTDTSRAVIARFGEQVRCVFKENGGQGSAMNAGFAESRGDIVLFLDADDYLGPEAAARVVAAWHPGVAKVQFRLDAVDGAERPMGISMPAWPHFPADPLGMLRRFGYYPSPPCSGNAYPRSVLNCLMPIPEAELRFNADTHLFDLAPFLGEVINLPVALGYYRIHGQNGSEVGRIELATVRRSLENESYREAQIRKWAGKHGWSINTGLFRHNPSHCKKRLISLRVDPARHPFKDDRRWRLVVAGIAASMNFPHLHPGKRVVATLGFLLLGLAPAKLITRNMSPLINALARPRRRAQRLSHGPGRALQ